MTSFPIQIFIGAQRARGVHIMMLAICTPVMFIDGLDIFMGGANGLFTEIRSTRAKG
ncbi:hypothetical protein [Sphingobium sp. HWE2-09]|uniref:hypothetical protein n=1 Tax=Sphingobium sp. HWE2-09 TaxID=3108390 RepID=UPI002DCBDB91|nr:hypothetical protein [Sphingobium sp. HWE2-09]